jgi:hypothetical protein
MSFRSVTQFLAFVAGATVFAQAPFEGSVPTGLASPTPMTLIHQDVIDRVLRANLGLPKADDGVAVG